MIKCIRRSIFFYNILLSDLKSLEISKKESDYTKTREP